MHPMKATKEPSDPRKMFLKTPFGPHFVTKEVSHPLSAPITIPAVAQRTSAKITNVTGTANMGK
jgi:hypothetical protein